MSVRSPSAYLDTSVISGFAKQDLKEEELSSMFDLAEMYKRGALQLRTSEVAREELKRHQGDIRFHEAVYNLLVNVPIAAESDPSGMLMGVSRGEDTLFTSLKELLPDVEDARHVYQASKNNVDYFVTADEKTILRYAKGIGELCDIKARSPSQVVAELS